MEKFAIINISFLKEIKNIRKYVQKQLEQLDKNFMDYLYYWNEKYYRNGFADGIEIFEI